MRSARECMCTRGPLPSGRPLSALHVTLFTAALVLSGISASAATISNRDDKEQKLTIIEGEAKVDQTLKPLQVLEKVCLKGCIVRLNDSDDDEYQLESEDVVSIEDGYLYHDATDAPPGTAPPAATPGQPAIKQ